MDRHHTLHLQKTVVCEMDHKSWVDMQHSIGVQYGDPYVYGAVLKNMPEGTDVYVDGDKITSATPKMSVNGYQGFGMPKDVYWMSIKRPDGSVLNFNFLYNADNFNKLSCVLDFDELSRALKN